MFNIDKITLFIYTIIRFFYRNICFLYSNIYYSDKLGNLLHFWILLLIIYNNNLCLYNDK